MSSDEISTVAQLLAQVEEATAGASAVIEQCSEEEWAAFVPDEERAVGVVLHHIAYAYPFVVDWACQLVRGEGVPAVSLDDIHALNHQHAEAQATVGKAETLALFQNNTAAAKEQLGALSDADLQASAPLPLIGGKEISVQQVVQWFLINHAHNHIEAINQTLGGRHDEIG